jgi:hypothetical protein
MQFCERLRHKHTVNKLFLHNILRTDEACFKCEGVQQHNSHHSARDKSYSTREHELGQPQRQRLGLDRRGHYHETYLLTG